MSERTIAGVGPGFEQPDPTPVEMSGELDATLREAMAAEEAKRKLAAADTDPASPRAIAEAAVNTRLRLEEVRNFLQRQTKIEEQVTTIAGNCEGLAATSKEQSETLRKQGETLRGQSEILQEQATALVQLAGAVDRLAADSVNMKNAMDAIDILTDLLRKAAGEGNGNSYAHNLDEIAKGRGG